MSENKQLGGDRATNSRELRERKTYSKEITIENRQQGNEEDAIEK